MDTGLEFIIWGVPPGATEEAVLYTLAKTRGAAESVITTLETMHGCTKCHIQELDLRKPFDFVAAIGLKGVAKP